MVQARPGFRRQGRGGSLGVWRAAMLVEVNPLPKGASQKTCGRKRGRRGSGKARRGPACGREELEYRWLDGQTLRRLVDVRKTPSTRGPRPPTYASRPLPPRRRRRYSTRRAKLPSRRELLAPSTLCRSAPRRAEVNPLPNGASRNVYASATFTMRCASDVPLEA